MIEGMSRKSRRKTVKSAVATGQRRLIAKVYSTVTLASMTVKIGKSHRKTANAEMGPGQKLLTVKVSSTATLMEMVVTVHPIQIRSSPLWVTQNCN